MTIIVTALHPYVTMLVVLPSSRVRVRVRVKVRMRVKVRVRVRVLVTIRMRVKVRVRVRPLVTIFEVLPLLLGLNWHIEVFNGQRHR